MAENSATQLEKLEADQKKAMAALAEANEKLASFRNSNRGPKLAELKQEITNYGFTAIELFGVSALNTTKPNAKAKAPPSTAAIVKYQDDQGNTWGGGKGPRPGWIKAIQEAGGDIEKYRVTP
ncbi:MAG: H-NS histone family protein [Polaromonas sp.]|uniref:H-NS histone family protein n=1 Tax=Polaromonas sp. TaxID=1869339 RepID=UPI00181096E4|nr:H-NS histone family protein [Polaromonas sp.]NMM10847.1 H-NS histone family protein [Polaromonas sp.]